MKKINGPINVVRMEGTINGVKKIIYLFMDQHLFPNVQSYENPLQCTDMSQFPESFE